MKKYSILFTIAYFILTYALGELADRLHMNAGVTFNITATLAAVFIAGWWFSREQKRRPTPLEINAFSAQGLLGVWIASILLAIIVFTFLVSSAEVIALLSQIGTIMLIVFGLIGVLLISLIYYVVIRWAFTWFTKLLHPA